jgi:hypothetical protein
MKKIILLIIFAASFIFSRAQVFTKPNNSYGTIQNRGSNDSTQYIPTFSTLPTDTFALHSQGTLNGGAQKLAKAAEYYDSLHHHYYIWDPSLKTWIQIDGGGGSVLWGSIGGFLSNQTDLMDSLNLRLRATNNLSDLTNQTIARTNLGLGSLATANTVDNTVWSGVPLSITNGGTGLNAIGSPFQMLRVNAGATALEYFNPTYVSTNIYNSDGTITASADRRVLVPATSQLAFSVVNSTTDSITTILGSTEWVAMWQSQPNAGLQSNSFLLSNQVVSMQSVDIFSSPNHGGRLTIDAFNAKTGATYTDFDATPTGIKYAANYDATFTARSLVDKSYVDAAVLTGTNIYNTSASITADRHLSGSSTHSLYLDSVNNFIVNFTGRGQSTQIYGGSGSGSVTSETIIQNANIVEAVYNITPFVTARKDFYGDSIWERVTNVNTGGSVSGYKTYEDSIFTYSTDGTNSSKIVTYNDSILFSQNQGKYTITNIPSGTAVFNLGVDANNHIVQAAAAANVISRTKTTSGTNTSLVIPSGYQVLTIIIIPASTLSAFQVGTTSTGTDVIGTQAVGTGGMVFNINEYFPSGATLYFQGITSSTQIITTQANLN